MIDDSVNTGKVQAIRDMWGVLPKSQREILDVWIILRPEKRDSSRYDPGMCLNTTLFLTLLNSRFDGIYLVLPLFVRNHCPSVLQPTCN